MSNPKWAENARRLSRQRLQPRVSGSADHGAPPLRRNERKLLIFRQLRHHRPATPKNAVRLGPALAERSGQGVPTPKSVGTPSRTCVSSPSTRPPSRLCLSLSLECL